MNRATDVAAVALFFFAGSCATSPSPGIVPPNRVPESVTASKSFEERLRFGIDARLKAGLGFGVFAAVREEGKTTAFAAGRRSLEPVAALGTRDLLEVGSVTKTFTGILVHLAEAEGKLEIDQKLEDFFPTLRGADTGRITVRELGVHESGLPSFPEGVVVKDESNPWRDLSKEVVLAALLKFKRPSLPEGRAKRENAYSNWGYVALGLVLEKVYRMPFPKILETRLLAPLRMTESGIDRRVMKRGKWVTRVSPGFGLGTDPIPAWDFASFAAAAGGLESNAVDMGRFLEALASPPSGKLGESIRATFISGIGWDSEPGNTRPLWKNGMTGGFASILTVYPNSKAGLFVATNTKVAPEALSDFATGVTSVDTLMVRAAGARAAGDDELSRLKGKYRNPKPAEDPKLPLRSLEIVESVGRIVARYDFGFAKQGALLAPGEKSDVWNVIDGSVNLDEIRILADGVRATVTNSSGHQTVFELEKLPADVQNFPALEKEGG